MATVVNPLRIDITSSVILIISGNLFVLSDRVSENSVVCLHCNSFCNMMDKVFSARMPTHLPNIEPIASLA